MLNFAANRLQKVLLFATITLFKYETVQLGGTKYMSRVCSVCGKGRMSGNAVSHSNRKTRRSWAPNVQKVKVNTPSGGVQEVYVCARCLRSGKVDRA